MLWLVVQQEILAIEKVLLEGLRFDLLVELPYFHLLRYIKQLQGYLLQLINVYAIGLCCCLYYHEPPWLQSNEWYGLT